MSASAFTFVATAVAYELAVLELCYNNSAIFCSEPKLRKGQVNIRVLTRQSLIIT